jgi:hypothetical protein
MDLNLRFQQLKRWKRLEQGSLSHPLRFVEGTVARPQSSHQLYPTLLVGYIQNPCNKTDWDTLVEGFDAEMVEIGAKKSWEFCGFGFKK